MASDDKPAPAPQAAAAAPETCDWARLFSDTLLERAASGGKAAATVPTQAALAGKHVAVYFSAHWCPPCRAFTPQLAKTYAKLQKDGVPFEVVFVSMDRSADQFDEYFSTMPWLAVPYVDDQLRSVLTRKFKVMGIPQLVILAPDSTVLCANARGAVSADPDGGNFPWEGAKEPRGMPTGWLLVILLVFWLINTYFFPPKPKGA